jgi:dTMP kinase
MARGRVICVEGVEGAGKSTQLARLDGYLRGRGHETLVTREPGGTPMGEEIRRLLLSREDLDMSPVCEFLLFEAARAQHVRDVVRPALAAGRIVLSDRFSASTFAYQAVALGVGEEPFERVDEIATGGLRPDLTIILDVPPEVGMERKLSLPTGPISEVGGDGTGDRIEQRSLAFHVRVRDGYRRFAEKHPDATVLLDGARSAEAVHADIVAATEACLSRSSCHGLC